MKERKMLQYIFKLYGICTYIYVFTPLTNR